MAEEMADTILPTAKAPDMVAGAVEEDQKVAVVKKDTEAHRLSKDKVFLLRQNAVLSAFVESLLNYNPADGMKWKSAEWLRDKARQTLDRVRQIDGKYVRHLQRTHQL